MAAATCPHCGAYTSTATGYCGSCRRPLAPPPPPYGAYGQQPHAQPGYGQPVYGQPAPYPQYAMPYVPMVYVPLSLDPPCVALAKQAGSARWAAAVLDLVVVFVGWIMLAFFAYPAAFGNVGWFGVGSTPFIRFTITLLWIYLYYAILDGYSSGTLGKRAVGLTLVDRNLKRVAPIKAFGRSFEIFLWPVGFIIIVWIQSSMIQDGGQSIGDRLSGCYLVNKSQLAQYTRAAQ